VVKAVLTRVPVEAYAAALAPLGIEVVTMEVTRQQFTVEDMATLAKAVGAGPYAATIVASRTAAQCLAMAVLDVAVADARRGRDGARRIAELGEIWAVGPATAHALQHDTAFVTARIAAHAGLEPLPPLVGRHPEGVFSAEALARAMLESRTFAEQRVLVPRAAGGRTEASEILRAAGAEVVEVTAYRTTPVGVGDPAIADGRELLKAGAAAACCVFAPSQVAALVDLVGPLAALRTQFVAIGETTAAALREAGVTPLVAATPTPEGLAQAIALHLRPA
jgi:uroporphyrinogen-III synthase